MKSLTQFIKESQEIHESLIGDVVRKLLDTGLSWIEGSVKWIANKSTDAVGEIWKTHRDVLTTTYSDFRRAYPQYKFLPETVKTPEEYAELNIAIYFNDSISADDKINRANTLIAKLKKRKGSKPGAVEAQIAIETSQCYVGIIKNPKVTASDKAKADNFVNKVKSSVDDNTKNLIDSNIQSYMAKILMDIKSSIDLKTSRYTEYNLLGNNKYDYARYGILNKCLPKILFKGNSLLVSFLQAIDVRLVMMFKWIDKLKHFKHITWY